MVMAHLKALETRDDAEGRFASKLAITRRLYDLGYQREDVINLFGFIDARDELTRSVRARFLARNTTIRGGSADAIHHKCREKWY